jgi:hypothetical protein
LYYVHWLIFFASPTFQLATSPVLTAQSYLASSHDIRLVSGIFCSNGEIMKCFKLKSSFIGSHNQGFSVVS